MPHHWVEITRQLMERAFGGDEIQAIEGECELSRKSALFGAESSVE
jgi:hypothetical protein